MIIKYYFNVLIYKKICEIQDSGKTIYNMKNSGIFSDGNYSIIIYNKEMKNYIKNFPKLYFTNINYYYIFYLSYKDLFLNIYNFYYFNIIFLNNQTDYKDKPEWYLGLPFSKQYQFILNFDSYTIGFYNTRNSYDNDD